MRKIIIILLPILTAILSFYTFDIFNNKNKGVSYWSKNILICQNKSLQTEKEVFDYSYDCLKNSIRSAVFADDFNSWFLAAEPIMANDIRLEYVCHIPGHDLGREFSEYFKNDYKKAIMSLGYDICGGGIVHGIFDIWGKEEHALEDWLKISEACIEQNIIRYSTCGDAIGHSAYESVGNDLKAAVLLCDKLQQDWIRNSCANGAFMQRYFPQSSALKTTRDEPVPDWKTLVQFCDRIIYQQSGTSDGCYGGAGWVIGNDIFFKAQLFSNSRNDFESNPKAVTKTIEMIKDAIIACRSGFDSKSNKGNPEGCISLMLNRMPLFWYMDINLFIENCEKISSFAEKLNVHGIEYDFFSNCITGGYEHINKNDMDKLIDKFPKVKEMIISRNPNLAGLVKEI